MKDNNQSDNLRALIDAGMRSFKIEGRYKDMGYVKNITAHYRTLLDAILEERPELRAQFQRPLHASPSRPTRTRTSTASSPTTSCRAARTTSARSTRPRTRAWRSAGSPRPARTSWNWKPTSPSTILHNGDGLCYYDLQKELVGVQINRAEPVSPGAVGQWRVFPKDPMTGFRDLRARHRRSTATATWTGCAVLEKKSAERRIGVWLRLDETAVGLALTLIDEDGHSATANASLPFEAAKDAAQAQVRLRENLASLGDTMFEPMGVALNLSQPWFVPASVLNTLRRDAVAALEAERAAAWRRLPRATPVEPPAPYPEDTLTYLANVYNHKARDFYASHGVKVIAAAYESHEEEGEVSLMITKHCVRCSMSLCPKQAKGVTGVQGTIRAEPLTLVNGNEKLSCVSTASPAKCMWWGRSGVQC